jgi:methyl-accepting chemotaxis protein
MEGVIEHTKQATDKMQMVSVSLQQEARKIHDINDSVEKVSNVIENNCATSEEAAAISEEQAAQAASMTAVIDRIQF